jgi:hypothetical protein
MVQQNNESQEQRAIREARQEAVARALFPDHFPDAPWTINQSRSIPARVSGRYSAHPAPRTSTVPRRDSTIFAVVSATSARSFDEHVFAITVTSTAAFWPTSSQLSGCTSSGLRRLASDQS